MTATETSGQRALTAPALAVTRRLLTHGPATREGLGQHLRLSEASLSRVARTLLRDGMISERPDPTVTGGRPRQLLQAVPSARYVIGVKLTGDTAYGVACDLLGTVVGTDSWRLPKPVRGVTPVKPTVNGVAKLARGLARGLPSLDGVGVSVGGVVSDRRVVTEGTFLGWNDVDIAGPLETATGTNVVISNDVTALAREQLWFGAGRTHATFGLVTVGAGLGFGVVREGQVVEQLLDNGHLLGHAPVDTTGPPCPLGHRGCVAAFLYREAIEARMSAALGRPVTYDELVDDAFFTTSPWFLDAARALGHLVATFAGGLATDRIVLAGEGVAPLVESPVMTATIDERLRVDAPGSRRLDLDVSAEPLDFSEWARGAAVVAIQHVLGAL